MSDILERAPFRSLGLRGVSVPVSRAGPGDPLPILAELPGPAARPHDSSDAPRAGARGRLSAGPSGSG